MAFPLVLLGALLIISGIRNTTGALGQLVAKDFSGSKNFFYWLIALVAVGSIGYIPKAQTPSRAFLLLIMVVMVISDKGFFAQFTGALSSVQNQGPSKAKDVGAAQDDPNAGTNSGPNPVTDPTAPSGSQKNPVQPLFPGLSLPSVDQFFGYDSSKEGVFQ